MTNITYRGSSTSPATPGSSTAPNLPLTNDQIDGNFKSISDDIGLRAPLASPTFTGTVTLNNAVLSASSSTATQFYHYISNSNTATNALTSLYVGNATTSATSLAVATLGTGYTTNGAYVQDGSILETGDSLSGGLTLSARAGGMHFYTGGVLAGNRRMSISNAGAVDFTGAVSAVDLTLSGNLTVNGTTTTINSTVVAVDDINIELGAVTTPTDATANGGGITLRGATNKTITWDSTNTNWTSSEHWNLATGKSYKINNVDVLTATGLGSGVTSSSLTSVGTLAAGTWNATAIGATYGGTGQTVYAVGDILYASTTTALSKLADVATGNVLISGGVNLAPSYGKVGLTTHVSGTLPVGNGGTGLTTYTIGDIVYASGTGTLASLADVATGNVLISGGVGAAPSYGKVSLTSHISGTLAVGNGGTGTATAPTAGGLIYGASASAYGSTAAGTTYQLAQSNAGGAPTWASFDMSLHAPDSSYKKIVRLATTTDLNASTFAANVLSGYTNSQTLALTTTAASTTITTTSTAGLLTGAVVNAATIYVAAGTTVASIASATTFTVNNRAAITTTAITGNGTTATATFAAQTYAPYAVGSTIVISGTTPASHSGSKVVTACTTTTVSWASTETVTATVQGSINFTIAAGTSISTNFTQTIAALSIDGTAVALNDRVLVKDQTLLGAIGATDTAKYNGIYYVSAIGSTSVPWTLTRSVDADSATDLDGAMVNVSVGTVNGGKTFKTYFLGTSTLNTTPMYWNRFVDASASSLAGVPTTAVGIDMATDTKTQTLVTGAVTDLAINSLGVTTVKAVGASTYTRASTLYIAGAPVASTNATITTPYAMYVASGNSYLGGNITVSGSTNLSNTTVTGTTQLNTAATAYSQQSATAAPTVDMFRITNAGYGVTTAGVSAIQINYVGGAAAVESSASRVDITPGTTSGGIWNGFRVVPTAAAATGVVYNAMKFDNITAGAGTDNILYVGTGYDNILNYNGTPVINGTGNVVASQLTGTIPAAVLGNSTTYVGTTAIALNRASANQSLTGITNVVMPGAISGTVTLMATANAGSAIFTFPSQSGTVATTTSTVSAATNIAGGAAGQVHVQTGADTTGFTAAGTTGQVLTSAGAATPTWSNQSALSVGTATNIAGGSLGTVPVQTGVGATGFTGVGTSGQVLTSAGAAAPAWSTLTMENIPDAAFKQSVACATTGSLTFNAAQATIDGVAISASSRVLVKNQVAPAQNGIYTNMTTTTWTRAADADTSSDIGGGIVNVDAGTVNGGKLFTTSFKTTDTLGTTSMSWYAVLDTSSTVAAVNGGTGQSSYAVGDLLYADTISTVSKLADVATGNVLLSGGAGVAPSYGKVGLTSHVSGTLPVANGGTGGTATPTNGGVGYGTGTALAYGAAGTTGQILTSAGAAAPTWSNQSTLAVGTATNIAGGLTGSIPYQTGAGATALLPAGAYGQVLVSTGVAAPSWSALTMENIPDAAFKRSVACATTAALTFNAAQATIDGVLISASSRVLIKDQAAPAQNGIYTNVTTTTWARAADADAASEIAGGVVNVDAGTVNGAKLFTTSFKTTDTLGTTAMNWYTVLDTSATVAAVNGGTGQSSYAVGDLLYAGTTTTVAKLADVATGNVLLSGGANVAPSYGKVGLTTHVSGTLPVANGGTGGTATPTAGGVGYGSGTALAYGAAGTAGQILTSGGAAAPAWVTTLPVANGGTGGATQIAALQSLGVLGSQVVAKSAAYTVIATDRGDVFNCTGTWTLTLTAAATLANGFAFGVANVGTGVITIDPNAAETVDGVATIALAAGQSCFLVTDGTSWRTIGMSGSGSVADGTLFEAATTISSNYTVSAGKNALGVGTLSVASGVSLTVPTGQSLVVVGAGGQSGTPDQYVGISGDQTISGIKNFTTAPQLNGITFAPGVGVGQTWQNVAGSRAFGTTYYNTTGKPILVCVVNTGASGTVNTTITINGVSLGTTVVYSGTTGYATRDIFAVPDGASYVVSGTSIGTWVELR